MDKKQSSKLNDHCIPECFRCQHWDDLEEFSIFQVLNVKSLKHDIKVSVWLKATFLCMLLLQSHNNF